MTGLPDGLDVRVTDGPTVLAQSSGGSAIAFAELGGRTWRVSLAPASASPVAPIGTAFAGAALMLLLVGASLRLRRRAAPRLRSRPPSCTSGRALLTHSPAPSPRSATSSRRAGSSRTRATRSSSEIDRDGLIKSCSAAAEPLLGYTAEELVGIEVYSLLHPDDLLSPANGPQRYAHKDGTYVVLEGRRLARRDELGFVAGVVTVLRGPAALTPRTAEQRIQDAVALEPDPVELFSVVAEETALDLGVDAAAVVRFETGGFGTIVGACEPRGSVNLVPGTTVPLEGDEPAAQGLPDRQGRSRSRPDPRRRPALGRARRRRRRPGAAARSSRSRRSPRSRSPTRAPSWQRSRRATSSRTFPITAPSTSSCAPSRGARSATSARSRSSSSTSTASSGSTPSTGASPATGCWPRSAAGSPRPSGTASSSRGSPPTTSAGSSPRPKASTAGSPPSGHDASLAAAPIEGVGYVTASAGVCDFEDVGGPDELLALAEVALVHAKTSGGDATFRYSAELDGDDAELEVEDDRGLSRLRALARELDAEDPGTEGHSERVSRLSEKLALSCGWHADLAIRLAQAALLHDVGKLGIGEAVLRKPGPLSESELEQIRNHPDTGAEIAVRALDEEQLSWIRHHHERWDGAGYPNGVAGEAIPAGARLLALAEAWDSMTSSRVYGERAQRRRCRRRVQAGARHAVRSRGRRRARPALGARRSGRRRRPRCLGRLLATRKRSRAASATWPASSSAARRPPRHHGRDERAAGERDDAVVVPRGRQPARLVHDDGPAAEEAVELAAVGDLREQPEQVASLRAADAECEQRALAGRREVDRPGEPREIPGGRVLADAERRLALDRGSGSGCAAAGLRASRSRRT